MSTDRELLELAAKAAGVMPSFKTEPRWKGGSDYWNPLEDDGDALRLAVTLRLKLEVNEASIIVTWNWEDFEAADPVCEYPDRNFQGRDEGFIVTYSQHAAAARRAIVRAAAEIGRAKP